MGNDKATNRLQKENGTTKSTKNGLRNKEFVEQNLLIDDLLENKHILTVYRMFVVIFIVLVAHLGAYEYVQNGRLNFGQDLVIKAFKNFHRFIALWIAFYLFNFFVYYCFTLWAFIRTTISKNSLKIKICDYFFLCAFILYYVGWLFVATWMLLKQELVILQRFIAVLEIIRMGMKMHAFVRSNAPRVLKYKPHTENDVLYPTLSHFHYFLWVPTLVYRDSYPRTNCIRWNYVLSKTVEFALLVLFVSVILEHYPLMAFKDYGLKHYRWTDIAVVIIGNIGSCFLFVVVTFYIIFNTWMVIFAEICTFADRLFYEAWWTSTNYDMYYRTWNVIVHDWLYAYVYKDFYEIVVPGNKLVAKLVVFLISAVFHEYILFATLKFVLPILFIQFFVCSVFLTLFKVKFESLGNIFILFSIGLGFAINLGIFAIEYYAQQNCAGENRTMYSYLIPKLLSCSAS